MSVPWPNCIAASPGTLKLLLQEDVLLYPFVDRVSIDMRVYICCPSGSNKESIFLGD